MQNDDLKVLFPGRDIEIAGEKFFLRPFPFGKIPKVIGCLGDIIHIIVNIPDEVAAELATVSSSKDFMANPDMLSYITSLVELGGENLLDLVALAVNKPRTWVDELDADQGLVLFLEVYTVNQDFFTKRFKPVLESLTKRVGSLQKPPTQTQQDGAGS